MKLRIRSVAAAYGFYRCGRMFPPEGIIVDSAEFEPAQLQAIRSEARLHVEEVSEDDIAGTATGEAEAIAAITAAFGRLEAADYGNDGKPKLDALRKLLPDVKITAALRDAAWAAAKGQ